MKEPENFDPEKYSTENLPQKRKEWDQLREADPVKWGELTQANADKYYRLTKEYEDKTKVLEEQKNNLTVELEKYKTKVPDELYIPAEKTPTDGGDKVYNTNNFPKTKQEWDELALENPTLHTDLRYAYNQRIQNDESKFIEAQAASRRVVQKEHPDMYLAELDDSGKPKVDDKGNVILKVDKFSGEPIFNPNSEKGKLWAEIYGNNPNISSNPQAAELMMAAMERTLRLRGQKMVNENKDLERENQIIDGQVVQDGVTPPKNKVELTFKSDEEKRHAEGMVKRGLYANLEDYVLNRDSKELGTGYYEGNSMPDFTKKQ